MQEKSSPLEPLTPSLELFNAISDEMRLKILMILSHSEFTVNELKEILGIHVGWRRFKCYRRKLYPEGYRR